MSEEFKTISAYPNYQISIEGRVRSKKKGHILKWVDNGKGYKTVKLYNESKPLGRLCLVHRLVLSTYMPVDNPNLDVNHKDGIKAHNHLNNLEWVTKSENTRHAHLTGLFNSRNKLTIKQVKEIKELVAEEFRDTYSKIASKYGVKASIINKIALGQLYGYV